MRLAVFIGLLLASLGAAHAQVIPQMQPGQIIGNPSAAKAPGTATAISPVFDKAFGVTADRMLYRDANGWVVTALSAYGRTLVDDADAATARTTLGVVIGTNVQAWDADLDAIAALAGTGIVRRTGAATWATGTAVSNAELATMAANTTKCNATAGSAVPTDCTAATMRTNIGTVIGTNVQAWDTDLDAFALKTAPTGAVVGTTDTQTLTGKTIAGASNTLTVRAASDITGVLPVANGGVDQTAWTAFTPTVAPVGGTLSGISGNNSRYKKVGKTVFYLVDFICGTFTTPTGRLKVSLPTTPFSVVGLAATGGNATSGVGITGFVFDLAGSISVQTYTGAFPAASGDRIALEGFYEEL